MRLTAAWRLRCGVLRSLGRATVSGGYYVDGKRTAPSKEAQDPAVAAKVWALSEKLTGVAFAPE